MTTTRRRGLIFWALGLRSFRCAHCHRDIIYRDPHKVGLRCRWCDHLWFDFAAMVRRSAALTEVMRRATDAYVEATRQMQALNDAIARTPEDFAVLQTNLESLGKPIIG